MLGKEGDWKPDSLDDVIRQATLRIARDGAFPGSISRAVLEAYPTEL